MALSLVGRGVNFLDLGPTVEDQQVRPGGRVQVVMTFGPGFGWVAGVMDWPGAELAFMPFVPEGMRLVDVHGEGSQGIVELRQEDPVDSSPGTATMGLPIFVVPLVLFLVRWGVLVVVAGFILNLLVQGVEIFAELLKRAAVALMPLIWLGIALAAVIVVGPALGRRKRGAT